MAIDFETVFKTLYDIQKKVDEMVIVAKLIKNGGHRVPELGFLDFSTDEINTLRSSYFDKKAELTILYGDLP